MLEFKSRPSVTISMISFNDEKILIDCLESIFEQDYPKEKIHVLMVDGGSTDQTVKIAEKYGKNVRVIRRPDLRNRPDLRGKIALSEPKTDLVCFFSADNRFGEKNCLREMIRPFTEFNVAGSETFRYGFRKNDPILSRYFALIGGGDPVAVELGKADRAPYDVKKWHSFGKATDVGSYYIVEFEPRINRIPTLGANGFIFRRDLLKKIGGVDNADHTGICVKLIRNGYNKFAFAKENTIIHYITIGLISFLKRRILYAKMYSATNMNREYVIFTNHDWPRLLWITITFPTLIIPIVKSLWGYSKKPDTAWFMNVLICPAFFYGYLFFFIRRILTSAATRIMTRKG